MNKQTFLNWHYFTFIESLNWDAALPTHVTVEYFCCSVMIEAAYIATYTYNQMSQVKSAS